MRLKLVLVLLLLALAGGLSAQTLREAGPAEAADRRFVLQLIEDGEAGFALKEIEAYQKRYPKGAFADEMWFLKARLHQDRGETEAALEAYGTLRQRFAETPYRAEAQLEQARLLLAKEQYAEAEALLAQFQRESPETQAPVNRLLGQARMGQKDFSGAAQAYQEAYKNQPEDRQIRLDLAWSLQWAGRAQEAAPHFEALLEGPTPKGEKAQIAFELARHAYAAKDYTRALRLWKRQLDYWPHAELDRKARFWAAETVVMMEKPNKQQVQWALEAYNQNLAHSEPVEAARSLRHRGLLFERTGRLGAAEDDYARLQNLYAEAGQDAQLTLHRAQMAANRGDLELARRILVAGLGRGPQDPAALEARLRGLLFQMDRCEEAILRSAQNPLSGPARQESAYWLGRCYLKGNRYRAASGMFAILEGHWAQQAAPFYLDALEAQGRHREALRLAEKALEQADLKGKALFVEAKLRLLLQTEQSANAVEYGKSLKPLPSARAAFLLGQAHEKRGGKQHLQTALELYNQAQRGFEETENQRAALERRRRILVQLQDTQALAGLYQEALALEEDPAGKRRLQFEAARLQLPAPAAQETLQSLADGEDETAAEALGLLAELRIAQKDYTQARKLLSEGLAKTQVPKRRWRLTFRRAQTAQAEEDWQAALKDYQKLAQNQSPFAAQAAKQAQAIETYLKSVRP